jgi:GTP-binding protein
VYDAEITLDDEQDSHEDSDEIVIKNVNNTYYVEAQRIINVVNSINFNDYESMNYFQKVLKNAGVFEALEKKGIKDGDTVNIYGVEFDYYK